MKSHFLVGFFLLSQTSFAALPADVAALIQSLPEKKLNLPSVMALAIRSSDSFRQIHAASQATMAPIYEADALTDARVRFQIGLQDDRREPPIAFSPRRTRGSQYSLGVSSALTTGTEWDVEYSHGHTDMSFPTLNVPPYVQTQVLLKVSQSLWKNFLGSSLRSAKASAQSQKTAREQEVRQMKEAWFNDLARLFYDSWLSQSKYEEALTNVERRERLVDIVRLKSKRGTAERPDLLQIESSKAAAETRRTQTLQEVTDRLRALITVLKLPPAWLDINPMDIPITLDSPEDVAEKLCQDAKAFDAVLVNNSMIGRADALREAANSRHEQAKWENKPDLRMVGSVGANGVDADGSTSFNDTLDFTTPYWSVGLQLSFPLGFHGSRAAEIEASVNAIRADAAASQARDQIRVEWKNNCADLQRLKASVALLKDAVAKQAERIKLEEQRFRLGRSNTLQVTQAGDDYSETLIGYRSLTMQLKLVAWKLRIQTGDVSQLISQWENLKLN